MIESTWMDDLLQAPSIANIWLVTPWFFPGIHPVTTTWHPERQRFGAYLWDTNNRGGLRDSEPTFIRDPE